MNREQMIAWLTLEGWDSVDCSGACFARKLSTGECMSRAAGRYVPTTYGRLSRIAFAEDTQWKGWTDTELSRVVENN